MSRAASVGKGPGRVISAQWELVPVVVDVSAKVSPESISYRNLTNIAKSYLEAAGLPLGFNVVIFTLLNRLYLSNWIQWWKVLAPIPNYFCIFKFVLLMHSCLGKNIFHVSKAALKLKFWLKRGNLFTKFHFVWYWHLQEIITLCCLSGVCFGLCSVLKLNF